MRVSRWRVSVLSTVFAVLLLTGCTTPTKEKAPEENVTAKTETVQPEKETLPEAAEPAAAAPVAEAAPAPVEAPAVEEVPKPEKGGEEPFFEPNLLSEKEVVHPPFEWGDCTVCHKDKHPDKSKNYSLVMDTPDLCYQCHDKDLKEGKKFIHGPVAAGACTACHNPHKSPNKRLLVASNINELCTSCHTAKGEFLHKTDNIHPPVKDQCINCHDPHTEDYKFQLKADGKKDLCLMCHADKKEWTEKAKNKHGALSRPNGCQECHDPHGTGQPRMIKADSIMNMCLKCHNQPLKRDEDGVKLVNMAKHLEENPDWHGPIQWGDCAMCHNPHGSPNFRMLKKPFPSTFYASFDVNNYICFECHESKKITEEKTTEYTNFRNGTQNLHYVHVDKKKGRTCRACHDFHGTKDYPHHLRKKTKFGKINFPIRYIETPTGGSCAPACHARRYYDREKPIVNTK